VRDEIERALGPLAGLPLWGVGRAADLLWLHFGARRRVEGVEGVEGVEDEVGDVTLHVSCPWRLRDAERVLVGSGDLMTPADAAEDPETFEWDAPGASWLDVRIGELWPAGDTAPPTVASVAADALGGLRLTLAGGRVLELFPNATPSGHVTTEFWRLLRPGGDEPHFVVGTFGISHDDGHT